MKFAYEQMTSTLSFSDVATSAGGGEDSGINLNDFRTMHNKISTKEIANIISQNSSISKKEIYEYCLKLKNEK